MKWSTFQDYKSRCLDSSWGVVELTLKSNPVPGVDEDLSSAKGDGLTDEIFESYGVPMLDFIKDVNKFPSPSKY